MSAPVEPTPDNLHVALTIIGTLATAIAGLMAHGVSKRGKESSKTQRLRDQLADANLKALKAELLREVEAQRGDFKQLEAIVKAHLVNSDKLLVQQADKFLAALKGIQAMHRRGDERMQKLEEMYKEIHHFCERIRPGD